MPSFDRLVCAICDHLLRLLPAEPARAKRLDDIVDPDLARGAPRLALVPASGLRPAGAARRAAS